MVKDYKFKDIEKYLKKDTEVGKDIINAFEQLTNAAIIFSPIVFGVNIMPMLDLLDVKDKLFELGHKVYDFIAQKIETNYIDRMEQLQAAYALICYTAYFDTLQESLPKNVVKKLKLKLQSKEQLLEDSANITNPSDVHCNVYFADHITSFSEIKGQLETIYVNASENLISLIKKSNIYDEAKKKEEQELEKIVGILKQIPTKSLSVYQAQYLKLSDQFNDFALFAQLQNFDGISHAIARNKEAIDLITSVTKKIDVGLNNLNKVVNLISTNYATIQSQDIVDDLKRKYIATIQEPIIDDKEIISSGENIRLRFPKIVDAFIPQAYKCLAYQGKEMHLEDETVWKKTPTRHDLDKFFVKYLYSPDSIDYPLIILGHPGSGKSLLTKVLSAQLMSNSYTVIRIPLRDVNAEANIDVLVEDQIKKVTNRPLLNQGYGGFASQFSEKPLIIILDGYDELLQAKGTVFSGYLEKVRIFQQDQKSMNRPVRVIITSRITLIDKAIVPINSTILRLMEFDRQQRQTWIDIWNDINADYFKSSNLQPFSLPSKEKGKKNNILELAEQPLLLLMLAIYDSESNELDKTSHIKRTELYDNLLRRFVRRERSRYVKDFSFKSQEEQDIIIDREMNRLGVVAIGMYNRQEVVILSKQLEKDLHTFSAHNTDDYAENHTLKESESVLGGFFFIHKSTVQDVDAHSDNSESAFEFLHNTFGEFLAADFILRHTINEVKNIYVDRKYKSSGLNNKSLQPDNFTSGWFYCLMFVPLYSRPVVLEMLREHAKRALEQNLKMYKFDTGFTPEEFIDNLHFIVYHHLKMILTTRNSPSVMRGDVVLDRDMPLIGHFSTYSLNLVILAAALSKDGFNFCENEYNCTESNERDSKPWDKLASLWKAWFSPADLAGLSVVLKANRVDDNTVCIKCNERFEATHYENPIDVLLCVSSTLADDLITGLTGIQTSHFEEISKLSYKDIYKLLKKQSPDLYISYLLILLRREMSGYSEHYKNNRGCGVNYKSINDLIDHIIHEDVLRHVSKDKLLHFLESIECCLLRNLLFFSTKMNLTKFLPVLFDDLRIYIKKDMDSPELSIISRIIKHLIKSGSPLALDSRVEHDKFLRSGIFPVYEWYGESEKLLYYITRYSIDNEYLDVNFDYLFQMSPFKNKKTHAIDFDNESLYYRLFSEENIELLLQTNPKGISNLILLSLNSGSRKMIEHPLVDFFLEECLTNIYHYGFNCLGFDAIIDVVTIAVTTKSKLFMDRFSDLLQNKIFKDSNGIFVSLVYSQPRFVTQLIDLIPDVFRNLKIDVEESIYFKRKFRYIEQKKIIDYIGVLHAFWRIYNNSSNTSIEKVYNQLEDAIKEFDSIGNIDFKKLTINQYKDLIWYSNNTNNKKIITKIHKYLETN